MAILKLYRVPVFFLALIMLAGLLALEAQRSLKSVNWASLVFPIEFEEGVKTSPGFQVAFDGVHEIWLKVKLTQPDPLIGCVFGTKSRESFFECKNAPELQSIAWAVKVDGTEFASSTSLDES